MSRVRRTKGSLDGRSQAVLRAVIEEYVSTAQPVGSQALVDRYGLGVSSATVRNTLAELETAGLLGHPHTSAGRIPTDSGYRWYVEAVIDAVPLPAVEQLMIRHQFGQVEFSSEHWFRLAASTIAAATRAAGIATPAKPTTARVRRVDLVAINDRLASLVIVLREGTIKQVLLTLDDGVDQTALTIVASVINELVTGRSASEIGGRLESIDGRMPYADLARRVGGRIAAVLGEYDAAAVEDVYSDGLLNVMAAPEFAESDKLRRVFSALENRAYLGELVGTVAEGGSIRVFIGSENRAPDMRDVSLVMAPYGRPGRAVGVVGVLGPTRMAYSHAIGTVRFVSGLMHELVEHLYA
ncbi:MAG TPA: heat-inducible transcriptional repressor HrcA [Candidatus Limnocylindrales bacterium]|nr:heat-inducible transcriptional repressor HrcA [Candidatus Limnocylindrales bacterium]